MNHDSRWHVWDSSALFLREPADVPRYVPDPEVYAALDTSALPAGEPVALPPGTSLSPPIRSALGLAEEVGDGELLVTERQRSLAETGQLAFERAAGALEKHPRELVAYDLREGYKALMDLRGTEAEDLLVDEIFARFCIGK